MTNILFAIRGGTRSRGSDESIAVARELADRKAGSANVSEATLRSVYCKLRDLTLTAAHTQPGEWTAIPIRLTDADYPVYFHVGARAGQYAIRALIRAGLAGEEWVHARDILGRRVKRRVVYAKPDPRDVRKLEF